MKKIALFGLSVSYGNHEIRNPRISRLPLGDGNALVFFGKIGSGVRVRMVDNPHLATLLACLPLNSQEFAGLNEVGRPGRSRKINRVLGMVLILDVTARVNFLDFFLITLGPNQNSASFVGVTLLRLATNFFKKLIRNESCHPLTPELRAEVLIAAIGEDGHNHSFPDFFEKLKDSKECGTRRLAR